MSQIKSVFWTICRLIRPVIESILVPEPKNGGKGYGTAPTTYLYQQTAAGTGDPHGDCCGNREL